MIKSRTRLRTTLSIPVYAVSVLFWGSSAYTLITSAVKMLSRFATPELIGEGVFDLTLSIIMAAVGGGLWMLGRYIQTSNFRKQPKPSTANLR
ncbi:hypothetical protein PS834_04480 [Pseudomonas fluorescens]|nr:hypothetical protein PS834_04480 [Pseudomonas fluorescens]